MSDLKLSFHSTFALKKPDLIKLLMVFSEVKDHELPLSIDDLVVRSGLGTKKVSPMKTWGKRSGLLVKDGLSPEGRIVLERDPSLLHLSTLWLMHFYLSFGGYGIAPPPSKPHKWGGWPYFIFTFLPDHPTFNLDELINASIPIFQETPKKSFKPNFKIMLRAYTESQALGTFNFLACREDNYFRVENFELPNIHLLTYFLLKLWHRDFRDTLAVPSQSILSQDMGLTSILGISNIELLNRIDLIEQKGWIRYQDNSSVVLNYFDDPLWLIEQAYKA